MGADFERELREAAERVDALLAALLAGEARAGEAMRPARLVAAMRYSTLGGGKRLRPFLLIQAAALFDAAPEGALRAGAALECLHCYSLVHDDLPCMDDDDLRRGRPTTHIAFDEATAVLAGDALLTLAFEILADEATDPEPAVRSALVLALARAAGLAGMVGGQMLDLQAETRPLGEAEEIRRLQAMKTGALMVFACRAGALLGRASEAEQRALADYGSAVGEAFQIADDLLDAEGTSEETGKATAKDAGRGKATFVSLVGADEARDRLNRLVDTAISALSCFGDRAETLRAMARFVASRRR